jgi:vacuolar-type H+-ATPase subunit I/STV1
VKQDLSSDGYIVLTIDEFSEENKTPHFIFEALKDNINVTEGRVDALDIFSAYEILRNDYQYTVLKLYPVGVTDIEEQKEIFRNILLLYPNTTTKDKEVVKNKTLTDVDLLKTYLDTLEGLIKKSGIKNTEILLYDIKRAQNISSISSSEEIIKKTIKLLYNNGSLETKRELYVSMAPMAKRVSMVIFPPWFFNFVNTLNDTFLMIMILF